MSVDDWRERLRIDPRGTVPDLVRRFAARRSGAAEMENLFWRALVDYGEPLDLARSVLGRLRNRSDEPSGEPGAGWERSQLLDLDREHRVRVRGRLRIAASETLETFVRDPAERAEIVRDPVRLAQTAFARRNRVVEAAALYALEHDHLPSGAATTERLGRAALRYEVARALHRVEGEAERAFEIMRSVLPLLGSAGLPSAGAAGGDRPSLPARLSFHAREWLGLRHYEAGRYRAAEREFLRAANAAPETDLALAARIFAANALIRDGRQDEARQLLSSIRDEATREGEVAEQWGDLWRRLAEDPDRGADPDAD